MIGFLFGHPRRQCNTYVNTLRQVALLIVTGYARDVGVREGSRVISEIVRVLAFFSTRAAGHTLLSLLIATRLTRDRKKKKKTKLLL